MNRTGWIAALFLALMSWPCLAQFGGMGGMGGGMAPMPQKNLEEWTVRVETFGNQSVTGKLRLASVTVQCDLGSYEIKPEKIKSLELVAGEASTPVIFSQGGAQRKGSVITATGEKVSGTISVPSSWRIDTDLGTLTPDAQQLKTLTFVEKVPTATTQPVGRTEKTEKPGSRDSKSGGKPNSDQPSNKPGEPKPSEPEKKNS